MIIPKNKLCPMAFGDSQYAREHCLCVGSVCGWFDEAADACVVLSRRVVETAKPYIAPIEDAPIEDAPIEETPAEEAPVKAPAKPKTRTRKKAEE